MIQLPKFQLLLGIITILYALSVIYQLSSPDLSWPDPASENAGMFSTKKAAVQTLDEQNELLLFFENKGQINLENQDIRYVAETSGMKLYLKPEGIVYSFIKIEKEEEERADPFHRKDDAQVNASVSSVGMHWQGANADVNIIASEAALEVKNCKRAD